MKCSRCGSFAINDHLHGRIKGRDLHLCDVCYWRERAEAHGKPSASLTGSPNVTHQNQNVPTIISE